MGGKVSRSIKIRGRPDGVPIVGRSSADAARGQAKIPALRSSASAERRVSSAIDGWYRAFPRAGKFEEPPANPEVFFPIAEKNSEQFDFEMKSRSRRHSLR